MVAKGSSAKSVTPVIIDFMGTHFFVFPNQQHGYLVTTRDMSGGYHICEREAERLLSLHPKDFLANTHYIKSTDNLRGDEEILWTKSGVVRVGLYVDSIFGKEFRKKMASLIIRYVDKEPQGLLVKTEFMNLVNNPHGFLDILAGWMDNAVQEGVYAEGDRKGAPSSPGCALYGMD